MINFLWLFIAGLISGIIGGMGMGGGTLLIPILTIFLGFKQKNAQAINLLVFIPMSLIALIIHIKNKLVDFKVGIPVILSGVIFSILGSYLASVLSNALLKKIFAIFLLLVGINQGVQTIISLKKQKTTPKFNNVKFKIYIKKIYTSERLYCLHYCKLCDIIGTIIRQILSNKILIKKPKIILFLAKGKNEN